MAQVESETGFGSETIGCFAHLWKTRLISSSYNIMAKTDTCPRQIPQEWWRVWEWCANCNLQSSCTPHACWTPVYVFEAKLNHDTSPIADGFVGDGGNSLRTTCFPRQIVSGPEVQLATYLKKLHFHERDERIWKYSGECADFTELSAEKMTQITSVIGYADKLFWVILLLTELMVINILHQSKSS